MTREERLTFCKRCTKRKSTLQKGIVCSLTDEHAGFEDNCPDFEEDRAVAEKVLRYEENRKVEKRKVGGFIRFANYVLDYIVILVLNLTVGVVIGLSNPESLDVVSRGQDFLISYIIYFGYYSLFEGTTQRTLGKIITGTIVVNENGNKPSFSQILGRSLSRLVPFNIFSFLGSEASGWHDTWSKTRVLKKETLNSNLESLDSDLLEGMD